jgi:hypothetical protein
MGGRTPPEEVGSITRLRVAANVERPEATGRTQEMCLRLHALVLVGAVVGLMWCLDAPPASARDEACLSVFVSDQQGQVIPGATVSVPGQRSASSCRCQVVTNIDGIGALAVSAYGPFRVSVSLSGFLQEKAQPVILMPGHSASIRYVLRPDNDRSLQITTGTASPTPSPTPPSPCCRPACR